MKKDTIKYLVKNFRSSRSRHSFEDVLNSANLLFEDIDTPVSLGCYLRLKYSPREYLSMDINPSDYISADSFFIDYQCIKLFSKAEFFPSVYDTRKAAEVSFIEAEKKCRDTNARFASERSPFIGRPVESAILFGAQRKISRMLGNAPSISDISYRFGPGANVGLSKYTSVFDKLDAPITLTSNLVPYARQVLAEMPSWCACAAGIKAVPTPMLNRVKVPIRQVSGSKLGFVPKTAKTDRAICTEPLLNSVVQLGIGRVLRNRLNRAGCNLNTQKRNQELARVGSITSNLATIDLSAASDTISYQIVHRLLPAPWFNLLSTCRSESFTYEGKSFQLEKFSSMGNGYTFELETLLFLSLARSTCDFLKLKCDDVNVYGDDIVIPVQAVPTFRQVLSFCGFTVNEDKSFSTGPFRESCGKDWYLGHDVRPLFLKKAPTNQQLLIWCNSVYRLSHKLCDHRFIRFYESLKRLLPKPYRLLKGPDGFGDGHLVSDPIPGFNTSHSYLNRGWDGKGFYTLTSRSIERKKTSQPVYAAALYGAQFMQDPVKDSKHTISRRSNDGYGVFNVRDFDRTVMLRAFHPWN